MKGYFRAILVTAGIFSLCFGGVTVCSAPDAAEEPANAPETIVETADNATMPDQIIEEPVDSHEQAVAEEETRIVPLDIFEVSANITEKASDAEVNRILSSFLLWLDGIGYPREKTSVIVIRPDTVVYYFIPTQEKLIDEYKACGGDDEKIIQSIGTLRDKFEEVNRKSVRLSLESSSDARYYVDYEDIFSRYFTGDIDEGWARFHEEWPGGSAFLSFSIPAYDAETGLVMIYTGMSSLGLAGAGNFWVFQQIDGDLELIVYYTAWIS